MKRAVFPGTFDPFTIGHEDLVKRGLELFEEIIIMIGINTQKKTLFSLEKRKEMIYRVFDMQFNVKVQTYDGLTSSFCEETKSEFLIRGLRTHYDFEYEKSIAQSNRTLNEKLETVFLFTSPAHNFISSTIVRDIILHDGDTSHFSPTGIDYKDYL